MTMSDHVRTFLTEAIAKYESLQRSLRAIRRPALAAEADKGIRWLRWEREHGKHDHEHFSYIMLNIRVRWEQVRNELSNNKEVPTYERVIRDLNWLYQQMAGHNAVAWLVVLVPAKERPRKNILPVSSEARPKYFIGGRVVGIKYSGMEGKNGAASVEHVLTRWQCRHYEAEIDGPEINIQGMRCRAFSSQEVAIAWYEEQAA